MSMKIEMDRRDWIKLAEFINAANEAKEEIERVAAKGTQQVSIKKEAIEAWLATKVPAQVWIKLGALVKEGLEDG